MFGIWWSFAIDSFPNVLFQTFDHFWHVPTKLTIISDIKLWILAYLNTCLLTVNDNSFLSDNSFSNFMRCILQSRRIKQTWKISFLEKLEMESWISLQWTSNYNVSIYFQVFYIFLYTYILDQAKNVLNITNQSE